MWGILIFLISVTGAVYLPIEMAFLNEDWTLSEQRNLVQHIVLYIFIINSIIQINLSYFDSDCSLISDKFEILINYLKKSFIYDILLIFSLAGISGQSNSILSYLLRLALLFWRIIYRNYNVTRMLDQYFYSDYWKAIRNLVELFV